MRSGPLDVYIQRVTPVDYGSIVMHGRAPVLMPLEPFAHDGVINSAALYTEARYPLHTLFRFEQAQELIIPERKVDDLLREIIELQRPVQADIRERQHKKTRAKIITVSDAA